MRSRPRWFVAAFLLTFVTLTRGEAPVSVRLRYSATAGCPTHEDFVEAVRARTPLARFGDEPGAWEVEVSAQSSARTSTGVLSGQGTVPREVSAKSCADVISALALILALAIDPQASATAAFPAASSSAPPSASAAPSAAAPPSASAAPAPRPAPPPAATGESSSVEPFGGFGAAIDGSTAFTPSWMSFLGPAVSVEFGARWTPVFSPSLRLTGALGFGSAATSASAEASFRLARLRLDLRPVRLELFHDFSAIPYLGVELGRLTGEGETGGGITEVQTESRDWLALAQGLAFELSLFDPVFLIASAEIREPLRRYQFVFQNPDATVAQVPSAELGWSAGVGARFW